MQIAAIVREYSPNNKHRAKMAQFAKKNNNINTHRPYHRYSGNVSKDLAWASMYDNKIAKELKLMGLI